MKKAENITLFFYGTLRAKEVREAVLENNAKKLILIDGFLIGFKLFKVKNTNYPLIIKEPSSKAPIYGLLANGINQEIIRKLDLFEGENYSRFKAQAYRFSDELKIEVELYMPNKKLEYYEPWLFEHWIHSGKENFFNKDFNKNGIKKPII